jgi:hypothetical protein
LYHPQRRRYTKIIDNGGNI